MKKSTSFWLSVSITFTICASFYSIKKYGTINPITDNLPNLEILALGLSLLIFSITSIVIFGWVIIEVIPKFNKYLDDEK